MVSNVARGANPLLVSIATFCSTLVGQYLFSSPSFPKQGIDCEVDLCELVEARKNDLLAEGNCSCKSTAEDTPDWSQSLNVLGQIGSLLQGLFLLLVQAVGACLAWLLRLVFRCLRRHGFGVAPARRGAGVVA